MRSLFLLFFLIPALDASSSFSTYIGDAFPYSVGAMTTDSAGNLYLTGGRSILTDPTTGYQAYDVFITKLDPRGNLLATYTLSGKGSERGSGIAVDASGNIWIAGSTSSPDFPLRNPLQSAIGANPHGGVFSTAFLTKLSPTGDILFSTFLGGPNGSSLSAIALDAAGNAYVTGSVKDVPTGFPTSSFAYYAKIKADGSAIAYSATVVAGHACGEGSSCFLSAVTTYGSAIAVDPSGNAYIAGNSNGAPTVTPGTLVTYGVGAFVTKVKPDGSVVYLTALGAGNYAPSPASAPANTVTAIAADSDGNAYITGYTSDPAFPATAGSYQPVYSIPLSQVNQSPYSLSPPDAFVAKLNPTGSAMIWATYLGGAESDEAGRIAIDPSGNVWISGTTADGFPVTSGFPHGQEFAAEFNSTGSALLSGSRFPLHTVTGPIVFDSAGPLLAANPSGVVFTVDASQAPAPHLLGVANAASGSLSGRFAPAEIVFFYGKFGVAAPVQGDFDSSGFLPTTLGGVKVSIGGTAAPLLYVSDSQINAVVPVATTASSSTQVQITSGATALSAFRAYVDPVDPGVFLNADGSAAALNSNGSVNSATNPAHSGELVSIWATGTGAFTGADGQRATAALDTCNCSIPGSPSPYVQYSGASPGLVNGATQINFWLPTVTSKTSYSFTVSVGGQVSNSAYLYVAP